MLDHTSKITPAAVKWAKAMANSVEANERRRDREPPVIDWDKQLARLRDILDNSRAPTTPNPVAAQCFNDIETRR